MDLNWTVEVIVTFLAAAMMSIAVGVHAYLYRHRQERYALWFSLFGFCYLLHAVLGGLSFLFGSLLMYTFSFLPLYIAGYFLIFAIDSISRDATDPVKVSIWTAFVVLLSLLSSQSSSFRVTYLLNGEETFVIAGVFQYVVGIGMVLLICVFVYVAGKMHVRASQIIKKDSKIFLAGSVLILCAGVLVAFNVSAIIPGIHAVAVAIGMILIAIAFLRDSKLAFVLLFKVLRLLVLDTVGGLALYTYDWDREVKLAERRLFSGMLQGITIILNQTVNQGSVQEIQLANAVLFLHRSDKYPAACVLVATKASPSLRRALEGFARDFDAQFAGLFASPTHEEDFQPANNLVAKWFGFVPTQENEGEQPDEFN